MATEAGPITVTEAGVQITTGNVGELVLEIAKGSCYLGPATVNSRGANGWLFTPSKSPLKLGPYGSALHAAAVEGGGDVVMTRLKVDPTA